MKTDIRYRAWDVYNKIMRDVVEISFDKDDGTMHGLLEHWKDDGDGGRVFFNDDVMVDGKHPEHVILMEYPPIPTDTKGKDVCEGDIIKEEPNGHIGIIKKDMGNFSVEWDSGYPDWSWSEMCYDHMRRVEVIGNVWQNRDILGDYPKLLKSLEESE